MRNYRELKVGHFSGCSARAISNQYVVAIPMGICDVPEYYPITKEEFETFDDWQKNIIKLYQIKKKRPHKIDMH